MNGVQGKAGWRWIFIIEGIITIAISGLVWLLVPDFPEKSTFLRANEKEYLLYKLEADKGHEKLDIKKVNWLKELTDYKIWFP